MLKMRLAKKLKLQLAPPRPDNIVASILKIVPARRNMVSELVYIAIYKRFVFDTHNMAKFRNTLTNIGKIIPYSTASPYAGKHFSCFGLPSARN